MDDKGNNQLPQPEPGQQGVQSTQSVPDWKTQVEYNASKTPVGTAVVAGSFNNDKVKRYVKHLKIVSVLQAFIIITFIFILNTPLGSMLPVITKEAPEGTRPYMTASPVMGVLFAFFFIFMIYQIILTILLIKNKRSKTTGTISLGVILLAIFGLGITGIGPVLLLIPVIAFYLVICNFNPCVGS